MHQFLLITVDVGLAEVAVAIDVGTAHASIGNAALNGAGEILLGYLGGVGQYLQAVVYAGKCVLHIRVALFGQSLYAIDVFVELRHVVVQAHKAQEKALHILAFV